MSTWTVARHEYITNVRRKEFILITLTLPLIILLAGGVSVLGTVAAATSLSQSGPTRVGLYDPGHVLLPKERGRRRERTEIIQFVQAEAGQTAVRDGKVLALIVLGADYIETGRTAVYYRKQTLLGLGGAAPVRDILLAGLLERGGLDPKLAKRAADPTGGGATVYTLNREGRFAVQDAAQSAAGFAVPYTFTILLITAIFFSASYLLRGISDEKENRVIEVILSSVPPDKLLLGKLIGLAGVGLTQVLVWALLGGLPAVMLFSKVVHISAATLLGSFLFFLLGFALFATAMAGLGALGATYRESQQIAGIVSIGAFIPMVLMPVLIEIPNGALARVLSAIPFTAPTVMVLRLAAAPVAWWEVAGSAAIIAVSTWVVFRVSVKLFRFGLLAYGKRPGFAETLRYLRDA